MATVMVEQISGLMNAMGEKIRIGNGIFEKDVKCFKLFWNYTTLKSLCAAIIEFNSYFHMN